MNVLEMEAYQSEWLSGLDLKGRQVTVIVDAVTAEQVQNQRGEKATKAAVAFRAVGGAPLRKRLLLNKTNAVALARLFGVETDGWKGQPVVLQAENVPAFRQVHCVVRVAGRGQLPKPAASNGAAEPTAEAAAD